MKNGDIVYGKITNIVGYGAFVQVDEYDGLVHISEFSDHFVRDINDYVHIGDQIKLKIIEKGSGRGQARSEGHRRRCEE